MVGFYAIVALESTSALRRSLANRRGIEVAVKTDKRESAQKNQSAMIAKLQAAGVPVEVSTQARLLHDKFAVIDGRYVVTGSYTGRRTRRNGTVRTW